MMFDRKGTFSITGDAKNVTLISPGRITFDIPSPKDGLQIFLTNSDPTDYVRNIRIVLASDESTYQTQPFNEDFLDVHRRMGAKVLRFMDSSGASSSSSAFSGNIVDRTATTLTLPSTGSAPLIKPGQIAVVADSWARIFVKSFDATTRIITLEAPLDLTKTPTTAYTNIIDLPNGTWAARPRIGSQNQRTGSGLALEYMIQMANLLKADLWLSIPPAVDDEWIREAAKLFKAKLDPGLVPYFEWANESWNYSYPGYHYSEAMMRWLGLGAGCVDSCRCVSVCG